MVDIGSKYFQTLERLREGIRKNTIIFDERDSINHACYFCNQKIKGKMNVLIEKGTIRGYETESKYFLDKSCYKKAELFFYFGEEHLSLN